MKGIIFLLFFFIAIFLKGQPAAQSGIIVTRGAYLQKVTPYSITIRWLTNVACNSKVEYGIDLDYGKTVFDSTLTTEHTILLTELNPNTKYFYSIGSSDQMFQSEEVNHFTTSPLTGSTNPVRIWVTGDFGTSSVQQIAVRDAYENYSQNKETNLWLWLGDNAYSNGLESEYQDNVFDKYPDQFKKIPVYPAIGNHDYANAGYHSASTLTLNFPYFSIFNLPQSAEAGGVASGTPKYYSFNYANIHFIALDSYGSFNDTGSTMYKWLDSDLNMNTQRWTVAYFHHPPYTQGSHNSDWEVELVDMRNHIVPLLEKYNVDVVLSGHSHCNERTSLMGGHYGLSNTFDTSMIVNQSADTLLKSSPFRGTVYAVCGTSGQNPGYIQTGFPMPCMYFSNATDNCSLMIDVEGDLFSCKYLTATGDIADSFIIKKSGNSQHGPVSPSGENNFTVSYSNNNQWTMSYYLEQKTNVKFDLINSQGEKVYDYKNIPEIQTRGYYNFSILVKTMTIQKGVYFIRMIADDKQYTQKVVLGKN